MIRTGYLRWEIDVQDVRSQDDAQSREVIFLARPSFRVVRVKRTCHADAAERFVRGEGTYDSVLRTLDRDGGETDVRVPDIGPRPFRYSESDRAKLPALLDGKTAARGRVRSRKRSCGRRPRSRSWSSRAPALRAGYARLVAWEIFRVIEGKSQPGPTEENEPMRLDAANYQEGVPELVAAELVRNVVEPKEFHEFCQFDCLTVLNGDKYYRIPRRPHGLIEVWDAKTRRAVDPALRGLPGSGNAPVRRGRDEVPARQAPARPALESGRAVQPAHGQVRGDAPRRWTLDD